MQNDRRKFLRVSADFAVEVQPRRGGTPFKARTVDLSAGYRAQRWEIRLDARNLGDRRDPVSESELGESSYYLLPSRRVDATLRLHF